MLTQPNDYKIYVKRKAITFCDSLSFDIYFSSVISNDHFIRNI